MRLTLWLLVDLVAVHRATRLVTKDIITRRYRGAVIRWAYLRAGHDPEILDGRLDEMVEDDMLEAPDTTPRLAVLVVCRWCFSIWCAAAVVAAEATAPAVWHPLALVLALSSGATFLARAEADH